MADNVVLERYADNPILCPNPANFWEAQNVSNAGATLHDGKVHILYRAEGFEKRWCTANHYPITRLGLAISSDGVTIEERKSDFVLAPVEYKDRETGGFGEHGIQDPRIARIDDTYYVCSAVVSRFGDRLRLDTTKDFKTFEFRGHIMPEQEMRTAGLFPGKIKGRYWMIYRPQPNMWMAWSDDLKTWHDCKCVWQIKPGTWYDRKLGIGATPIRQEDAWLLFWHAKDTKDSYRLGVMWLDLEDPSKILKVQEAPILEVVHDYEREGFCPNVVYTNGAVELNGKYIVYYGCGDRVLAAASVPVEECRLR